MISWDRSLSVRSFAAKGKLRDILVGRQESEWAGPTVVFLSESSTPNARPGRRHSFPAFTLLRGINDMLLFRPRTAPVLLAGWAILAGAVCLRAAEPTTGTPRMPEPGTAEVAPAEFGRLRALIRPHPGESKWADIPWQTSLWEARLAAAAEGKPIYILAADFSPLGFC